MQIFFWHFWKTSDIVFGLMRDGVKRKVDVIKGFHMDNIFI